jgi:C1A family cysteine protease
MAKLDQLPRAPLSGWVAGKPDVRDFRLTRSTPLGQQVLDSLDRRAYALRTPATSHRLDLSSFGPVRNQGSLNACCAFAGVSLMEYRARRDRGLTDTECSPGFLYKVTRDLMNKAGQPDTDGNVPTDSRTTMKAMTLVGVAPENVFATGEANLDREPDQLTYAVAANYKATAYWRVDINRSGDDLLAEIKKLLRGDLPVMFTVHFLVPSSLQAFAKETAARKAPFPVPNDGQIKALITRRNVEMSLLPQSNAHLASAAIGAAPVDSQARAQQTLSDVQRLLGLTPPARDSGRPAMAAAAAPPPVQNFVGHALVACGFDDDKRCLLVRNSWSDEWAPIDGLPGYGLLPYDYVTEGLTEDWWFISDVTFVDTAIFAAEATAAAQAAAAVAAK